MQIKKILILEDEINDADLILTTLLRSGYLFDIKVVSDKEEFYCAIMNDSFDAILSDNSLPQFNALNALKMVKENNIQLPFILVTGTTSEEFAVEIIKQGASDYILKDRLQRLPNAILNAINNFKSELDRIKHLEKIIKSEALMKEAEQLAHYGSWEQDIIHNVNYWSDECFRILDYEIGEVEPSLENFYKKIHYDDIWYVKQTYDIAYLTNTKIKFDCRILTKQNTIKHIENEVIFHLDKDGKLLRINGFIKNITEKKETEELILKKELSYKRLVDNIIDGILIDDRDGKVIFANDQFLKMFGFTNADLENMHFENYVAHEHLSLYKKRHKKFLSGENMPNTFEFLGVTKSGNKIWLEICVSKVIENGAIVGTQCAIRDISKNKNDELLRQKSEANLRAIFDNTDVCYLLLDINNFIVSFNKPMELFAIEQLDKIIFEGKNISEYFKDEKLNALSVSLNKAHKGYATKFELYFNKQEGTTIWYNAGFHPIINDDKTILGVIIAFREITARKNLELEDKRIKKDLIRRNNDLEQFAYIISHNLRAPVASILGLANLLLEHDVDNFDDIIDIITGIKETTQKLDDVIKDINNIISINKDIEEKKEIINFKDLTEKIVENINNKFNSIKFSISTDFSTVCEIYSLNSYFHSIFYNLISNGIKYCKMNTEPIIDICSTVEDEQIVLSFTDNGVGIDLEKHGNKIFGLYNRFHFHVEGKGMGLFMVKKQVELLGGKIEIASKVNVGTEFILKFPQ